MTFARRHTPGLDSSLVRPIGTGLVTLLGPILWAPLYSLKTSTWVTQPWHADSGDMAQGLLSAEYIIDRTLYPDGQAGQ